jgi:hypothetical protein
VVAPDSPQRAELETRIAALRAAGAPAAAPVAAVATTPLAPRPGDDHRRRRRALAIGLGVTGGAIVIGAVVVGVVLGTARVTPYMGNVSPGSQAINP